MNKIQELLSSGEFWTAVGSLAAVIGIVIAWRQTRSVAQKSVTGRDVDELPDDKAFVESQVAAIDSAKVAVALCLHTVHPSSANWKAQRVNAALAAARKRGLTVRVLAGTGQAQLLGAYELRETHQIDIRLNPELLHSDLRFLKVDAVETLLGIADTTREQSAYSPSHSWATLKTIALADALEREFQRLWISPSSRNLYEFCAEYVAPLRDRVSAAKLASDLGLGDVGFLSKFYDPGFYHIARERTYIFHGKSGAGKSTLIRELARRMGGRGLDLEDFVLPLVFRHGNENVVGERIRHMYDDVVAHVSQVCCDFVETGSDYATASLPALFTAIKNHGRTPVLVHCGISLDAALRRNAERVRPVPIEVLQVQNEEEERGTFRKLCAEAEVEILELSADSVARAAERFESLVRVEGARPRPHP